MMRRMSGHSSSAVRVESRSTQRHSGHKDGSAAKHTENTQMSLTEEF